MFRLLLNCEPQKNTLFRINPSKIKKTCKKLKNIAQNRFERCFDQNQPKIKRPEKPTFKNMTRLTLLFFVIISTISPAQDNPAYTIFESGGNTVSYNKMINAAEKADVVFFGEEHNDAISHWLELQVLKSLYQKDGKLTLAMEMFEADDQIVLNEYLKGTIEESHLLKEAKIWNNYKTDYRPLVEFAKEKKLNVVASNVPRRYANLIYRKGIESLDSLAPEAKNWIAPLPITIDITLPGYQNMIKTMGAHAKSGSAENMARSQAVKDATMAYYILKNKGNKILHLNGSYHSQNKEGIIWYLNQADKNLKVVTIQVVIQEKTGSLNPENKKLADVLRIQQR